MTKKKIIFTILYFLFFAATVAFVVIMSIYGPYFKDIGRIKNGDYVLRSELDSSAVGSEDYELKIAELTKSLEEQRQTNNNLKVLLEAEKSRNDANDAEIARLTEQIAELTKSIQAKEQLLAAYAQYETTTFILTFYNNNELYATRVVNVKSPTDYTVDLPAKTDTHKCVGWSVDGVLINSNYVPVGNTRFDAVWVAYTFLNDCYPEFEGVTFMRQDNLAKLQFVGNQFKLISVSDGTEVVTEILSVTKRDSDYEIYDAVYSDTQKLVIQPACDDIGNADNNDTTSHFHLVQMYVKYSSNWQLSTSYFYYY